MDGLTSDEDSPMVRRNRVREFRRREARTPLSGECALGPDFSIDP